MDERTSDETAGMPEPAAKHDPGDPAHSAATALPPGQAARLRRDTRRGFAAAGVAILGGWGLGRWLLRQPDPDGIPWPLRRVLQFNERVAQAAFRPTRLAPEFPPARVVPARFNGSYGLARPNRPDGGFDPAAWRLRVVGGPGGRAEHALGLDEILALPRHEQITELKCIEGWSTIIRWAGARLADVASLTGLAARSGRPGAVGRLGPDALFEYAGLATPDGAYYVGLDMPGALHPQTLLAYEMNGAPLDTRHGAPLRLVIPVKYGIKHIKNVGTLRFTDRRPADYWAERGYDWYSGH